MHPVDEGGQSNGTETEKDDTFGVVNFVHIGAESTVTSLAGVITRG